MALNYAQICARRANMDFYMNDTWYYLRYEIERIIPLYDNYSLNLAGLSNAAIGSIKRGVWPKISFERCMRISQCLGIDCEFIHEGVVRVPKIPL